MAPDGRIYISKDMVFNNVEFTHYISQQVPIIKALTNAQFSSPINLHILGTTYIHIPIITQNEI